jgi:hypothetical protein
LQIWSQQRHKRSSQQLEQSVVAAASPASSASSGSGSMRYLPLSESEASPMTPHSSLDSRHSAGVSFPASPRVLIQDPPANTRPGVGHVSEGNSYGDDGAVAEGMLAGAYGQDIFPDSRKSFESTKTLF